MFTPVNQAAKTAMQQASAFGLAALVTLSMLASINGLAAAPRAGSLLATGASQVAQTKTAGNS